MTSRAPSGASVRAFAKFCRPHLPKLLLVLLFFVTAEVFLAVVPIFVGRLVGAISAHPLHSKTIWTYALILIGLSSVHDLTWRSSELLYRKFLNPLSYLYETQLFQRVINQRYPYFVDKFTGKVSSNITTLSQEADGLMDNLCFSYSGQVVNLIAVVGILGSINWQTAVVFSFGLLCMYIVGRYTMRAMVSAERVKTDTKSTLHGHLIDSIANFTNVKAFRKEQTEVAHMQTQQAQTIEAAQRSFMKDVIFWGSMSFFVRQFLWPTAIALNVWLFLRGSITVAQMATLLATILLFSSTIWDTIWQISQFNVRMAKTDEAYNYLFGQTIAETETKALPTATFATAFALQNVSFSYPDKPDVQVLHDVNLTIRRGEKVGLVGRSGSGKSTLTKLLLHHYDVTRGAFLFDDEAVTGSVVASQIAFVPQDTALFHRSIADNIAYAAAGNVSRGAIVRASKQAEADEFIAELAEGYDTLVGERGVKLSGGQRQRIAIARAILRDAPILVLDEATSALDSESELHIQRALETLWQDKTVLAIAHRLSTLQHMDRIVVMDRGKVIEQGSHGQLLKQHGVYAKLWAHQSGGFIEE